MSCNDSIPISDIVAAVAEQLSKQYVAIVNGVARDLTLKGGVTLDSATKRDLCETLEDCIEDAISEAFKNLPTPDSLTIKSVELVGEHLRITMTDGTTFPVDLSQFTTAVEATQIAEAIKRTISDEYLVSSTLQGDTLVMVMSSGKQLHVPLTRLASDVNVVGGQVYGNTLVLTKNDGSSISVDLSQFANAPVAVGNTALANDGRTVLGKFLM